MPVALEIREEHGFDYGQLRPEARAVAQDAAIRIRLHAKRGAEAVVAIGDELLKAKAAIPHGRWIPWLLFEFGWSPRRAQERIACSKVVKSADFAHFDSVADLGTIDISALVVLSQRSTTLEARRRTLQQARHGRITHRLAKDQRDRERSEAEEPDEVEEDAEVVDLDDELVGCLMLFRVVQNDPRDVACAVPAEVRRRRLEQAKLPLAWLKAFVDVLEIQALEEAA